MKNPLITLQHEHIVITSKSDKQLRLQVNYNTQTPAHLFCQFADSKHDLFAAVFAAPNDMQQLTRRALSFIRAHLLIADIGAMETAMLQAVEHSLRSRHRS
jgi:hypothetical protein